MLIRCPTCASAYELAPELLPPGRILRCAHCRDAWVHADAPAAAADHGPEIVAEARFFRGLPAGDALRAAANPPRPAPRRAAAQRRPIDAATLAASVLLTVLVGGAVGAVAGKARVVGLYPPSAAVFATLGLPVNLRGLSLGDIRSTVDGGDGAVTLTLEGHITNLRAGPTPVPSLRIAVRDKNRRELYYWTAPAPKPELGAGETVLFHSRLSSPPRDGQDLSVSFADASTGRRRVADATVGDR